MNAEDVPEQVIALAVGTYLKRPGGVLLSGDHGEGWFRMREALAVALNHPDAQTAQSETARSEGFTAGQRHEIDKVQVGSARVPRGLGELLTSTPGDLRVDPDVRVDAAYQRGFTAGRATVASEPVESVLDTTDDNLDDSELYEAQLAAQNAARRHAEAAAEVILEQADLSRRSFQAIEDSAQAEREDRARRWEAAKAADAERVTSGYVIRRDAVFAAIAHAHAFAAGLRTTTEAASIVDRERIMDQVDWWAAQLAEPAQDAGAVVGGAPVGTRSAAAVTFAEQLLNAAAALREDVDSIHDSTTPGAFRLVLTDDTVLDVVVSEAPPVG